MPNGFEFNPMFARSMGWPTWGYLAVGGPTAGMVGGRWMGGPPMGMGFPYGVMPQMGPWLGGPMTWGGTFPGMYRRRGWTYGPTVPSDDQIRDMILDAIDADTLVPFDSDINVEVAAGVVTLFGTVPSKRIKHAAGDDAWWVPGVSDINNELEIIGRREKVAAPGPEHAAVPTTKITGKSE